MAIGLEDLQILKTAESIADSIWKRSVAWDGFARDVVGKQITCSADSIGANIAESFGRYIFREKPKFLYYSRGRLFETKYWLNRAQVRELINSKDAQEYVDRLTSLARQLNAFGSGLKTSCIETKKPTVREPAPEDLAILPKEIPAPLFSATDSNFLNH